MKITVIMMHAQPAGAFHVALVTLRPKLSLPNNNREEYIMNNEQ